MSNGTSKWRSFWYIYGGLMVLEFVFTGGRVVVLSFLFNAAIALIIWGVWRTIRK